MEPRLLLSAAVHPAAKKAAPPATDAVELPVEHSPVATSTKAKKTGKASKKSAVTPAASSSSQPYADTISPQQMQGAYLGTNFNFDGITGDGTGQTIALIDAYNDPGLVNSSASNFSSSDLAEFDAAYHLPNPPSFTKYGVTNIAPYVVTTPPTTTQTPTSTSGAISWEVEESLDVEWAHAMAPKANIVLIEAGLSNPTYLFEAVQAADALAGVSVVSMSFAFPESDLGQLGYPSYSSANSDLDSNSGITFVAAAGDYGAYGYNGSTSATSMFPAASPDVVSVGGTTLTPASNYTWSSETTWGNGTNSGSTAGGGGGGGGTSIDSSKPAYQSGFGSGTLRQYPDISLDANPNSNSCVNIYDSWDFGAGTPWYPVGGTSLSAPVMAGIVAVADQGRALRGLAPLNSNGLTGGVDIHTLLYSIAGSSTSYAADFHDITSGNATGPAGAPSNFSPEAATPGDPQAGYDLASGLGSPVAYTLGTDLAYYNISQGSSTLAINTPAVTNLYFKQDSNSAYTDVWVNSATPGTGSYTYKFPDADISSLTYAGTSGNDVFTLSLAGGSALETSGFTVNVTGYSAGTNTLTIIGPASGNTEFFVGPAYVDFGNTTVNFSSINVLNLNASTGVNSITVAGAASGNTNYTAGSTYVDLGPLGINFTDITTINLAPATGTNTLLVNGNATGSDAFTATSASLVFNSLMFNEVNISLVTLNPGTGTDTLAVNSGSVTIAQQTPGGGFLTRNFSSISIAASASAIFATAPLHTDRMLVETTTLAVNGKLDLGGNDMIIHSGNLANITALLATGYNNGAWNGTGIASAAANADTTHLTALGVIQNTLYGSGSQPKFDGASPVPTDVLIKFTYYGDTDLSGKVDGTDYSRIDNAYTNPNLTGWFNGDFNYDKHVDGSDYTLIDNAYNMQGPPL